MEDNGMFTALEISQEAITARRSTIQSQNPETLDDDGQDPEERKLAIRHHGCLKYFLVSGRHPALTRAREEKKDFEFGECGKQA
jgi:hypothetical protein